MFLSCHAQFPYRLLTSSQAAASGQERFANVLFSEQTLLYSTARSLPDALHAEAQPSPTLAAGALAVVLTCACLALTDVGSSVFTHIVCMHLLSACMHYSCRVTVLLLCSVLHVVGSYLWPQPRSRRSGLRPRAGCSSACSPLPLLPSSFLALVCMYANHP